jgi:hypothetical protein
VTSDEDEDEVLDRYLDGGRCGFYLVFIVYIGS